MELDIQEIQKIIPHRYPFLLIDRIIECTPNEKLVALKNVSVNESFFQGHFPEEKVMPGVLIIEAMAQAGCVFYHYSKNQGDKKLIYYLAKITSKFIAPVRPGDQLRLEVFPIKFMNKAGFIKTEAYVQDQKVVTAELGFSIRET